MTHALIEKQFEKSMLMAKMAPEPPEEFKKAMASNSKQNTVSFLDFHDTRHLVILCLRALPKLGRPLWVTLPLPS